MRLPEGNLLIKHSLATFLSFPFISTSPIFIAIYRQHDGSEIIGFIALFFVIILFHIDRLKQLQFIWFRRCRGYLFTQARVI